MTVWNNCRQSHTEEECVMDQLLQSKVPRLGIGAYAVYLRIWYRYLSTDQILVLSSEKLSSHPREVYQAIFNFLGVPQPEALVWNEILDKGDHNVNYRGSTLAMLDEDVKTLNTFYAPFNKQLRALVARYNYTHTQT